MGSGFVWFCFFARLTPPKCNSLDEYMDLLVPKVRYFGEDLAEEHFYIGKHWNELLEGSDDVILKIFEPKTDPAHGEGVLMTVKNGDVSTGVWSYLKGNKMVFKNPDHELFDLGFLNPYIFVIRKHGENRPAGSKKYLVLVSGNISSIMVQALGTSEVSPETLAELLFHFYAYNNFITGFLIIGLPAILLILYIFI